MTVSISLAEVAARSGVSVPPEMLHDWRFWARPAQLAPAGDWSVWCVLAGRGFGKTRLGVEWLHELEQSREVERMALVGPTYRDVRETLILGESGILSIYPKRERPVWVPSRGVVRFASGAIAQVFTAEEPERLRGPQHGAALCDELAAWTHLEETWDMLQMGMRLGRRPRVAITTTPRPIPFLRELVARAKTDPSIRIVSGSTRDNAANLPKRFIEDIHAQYGGTRLGRQELEGELLEDVDGGVIARDWIGYGEPPSTATHVVIAIDPSITAGGDETGIVAAARSGETAYVLEDASAAYTPEAWAKRVVDCARRWKAHYPRARVEIYAETNRGGQMVGATLRAAGMGSIEGVRFVEDHAYKGKATRAEPVAALYEQRRVVHCVRSRKLEDQLCQWSPSAVKAAADRNQSRSPDRMDALVHAVHRLGFHLRAVAYGGATELGGERVL